MMSERPGSSQWPTPLSERKNGLGKLVRGYVQDTEEKGGGGDVAYERLLARAAGSGGRPRRVLPRLFAGLAAASVVVTAALVLRGPATPRPPLAVTPPAAGILAPARPPAVTVPPAQPAAPALPTVPGLRTAVLHLGVRATALPAGRVDLDGQASAVLSTDGVASGRIVATGTEIVLAKGEIELQVEPRAPGQAFSVRAGLYRFTVVGTVFTVSQTRSRLELAVREGTVAVSRASKRLATVVAGGSWTVELASAGTVAEQVPVAPAALTSAPALSAPAGPAAPVALVPAPATSPPAAPAPPMQPLALVEAPASTPSLAPSGPTARTASPPPMARQLADCRQLVAGQRTSDALLCYQGQSAKDGLVGESAQYELARLWRDSLGNAGLALAAFQEQRARFPKGALRIEADLSIIELLPRLGRHEEAMAETAAFLVDHPQAQRRGELRLLRGNILREVVRDLARAEREYALGAEAGGRASDDCRFLQAVCLEGLGRIAEARKAYEGYLLGSRGGHAQEVKHRLERLRP